MSATRTQPLTSVRDVADPTAERSDHRARLIHAMEQAIEEKGYRQTTVADVVRIARTSRRSFYEHFADRDACFLALFDANNDAIMQEIAASVSPELPWDEQINRSLAIYLDLIAGRPGLSKSFAHELAALGEAGAERERASHEHFAELLVTLVESGRRERRERANHPFTMDMASMIVGGLHELTINAIQHGRDVHELQPLAAKAISAILNATVLDTRSSVQ
jgi:AcrR family transcriptional regulator